MGNKSGIAEWIISNISQVPHDTFCEVFGGTGAITINKSPVKIEFYNDFNPMLSNMMYVIKNHYQELTEEIDKLIISEKWYNEFYDYLNSSYDDSESMRIENAVRYFYIMSLCYMGKFNGGFAYDFSENRGFIFENKKKIIEAYSKRFKNIQVLNKSYERVIEIFKDKQSSVLYLDPPYVGTESYYKILAGAFTEADHCHLRDLLSEIKGVFFLSYEDDEMVRDLYSDYYFLEKNKISKGRNSIEKGKSNVLQEVLITNYKPNNTLFSHEQLGEQTNRRENIITRLDRTDIIS